jgi:glycosyltransferase involved in cell wall biosynthesis
VRYVGVVGQVEKTTLLGGAACVLMPSRDEEGFGLVALEAMACGTPVVALGRGALPEVIDHGVTGFVADEERGLAELVSDTARLDPASIRAAAERDFSVAASASAYLSLYRSIVGASTPRT